MKPTRQSALLPASPAAQTFEELEELRARLVKAQRDENEAIRKLSELNMRASAHRAEFDRLLTEARKRRERATAAYEAWTRAVERIRMRSRRES